MHRFKNIALALSTATIVTVLLLSTFYPIGIQAQSLNDDIISPELAELIQAQQDNPDQLIRFIITMRDQADLAAERFPTEEVPKRASIVRSLQMVAETSQSQITPNLEALQGRAQITNFQPFWIFNGIAAEGTADAILTLAKHSSVAHIAINHEIESIKPIEPITSTVQFSSAGPLLAGPLLVGSTGVATQTWGLERIRAPQVWHGLGITGTGVTVAIMDTGVDFEHPALAENYRGKQPDGSYIHAGNWFQAAVPTQTTPIDLNGHGTHVAGTAVGSHGIGVAPGAEWIAVGIADQYGLLLESYIHSGFEWMLAPDGKPELAPDIFNASWGGPGSLDLFLEDVELMKQAGIIPVFAAGNSGPYTQTIGSPGSYTNTIAIAATTSDDLVAWFSSRGPSPQHAGTTPLIAAPGARIYSAQPDNKYAYLSGTSMATPHTVGALALLLSAKKSLKGNNALIDILADSAVPFEAVHPNIASGYGMLDAVELVEDYIVSVGHVSGVVQSNGTPIANAVITVTAAGGMFSIQTDINGQYTLPLKPGNYSININHFGYDDYVNGNMLVGAGKTTFNINLNRKPFGKLKGKITQSGNSPLTAVVQVEIGELEPLEMLSAANGKYSIELPVGTYPINVIKNGYKVGKATVTIGNGQVLFKNFSLVETTSILLVDAGKWSFRGREKYYADALTEAGKGWDTHPINNPVYDRPTLETLEQYDVVIWSDPYYSPGYIGASTVISDYLGTGGNILISGSRIALYDYQDYFDFDWLGSLAYAVPQTFITQTESIFGRDGTEFSGFNASLNGENTADDQAFITTMSSSIPAKSELIFSHGQPHTADNGVGIKSGHCEKYNLIYLGFGVSGVQGVNERAELLQGSLDWFTRPQQESGVMWIDNDIDRPVVPGESYSYDLRVYNRSETLTTTFKISADSDWTTDILTKTLMLAPCNVGHTVVTVTVPNELSKNITNQTVLKVQSLQNNLVNDKLNINHKTAATLLLVDDHRWYSQLNSYKAVLDEIGIEYDVWSTHGKISWGSPPETLLQEYQYVVWYTAYDWFRPITNDEIKSLEAYLESGGRLFLTSQDFLYYHEQSNLARHYFGIAEYTESITPTLAYGNPLLEIPAAITGSIPITFNQYSNNGDSLILADRPTVEPLLWHDRGIGGVGNQNNGTGEAWRTVFWGLPFNGLGHNSRTANMIGILGWLGDLGDSSIAVDKTYVAPGESQTFTLAIQNRSSGVTQNATITNVLPAGLKYVPNSLSGGAAWDDASRTVSWNGPLAPGESITFTYSAIPQTAGIRQNIVTIASDQELITFQRGVRSQADGANLTTSTVTAEVG
ncbi:MAG: putative repeat protein (TIGR01451 family), partial [Candidatus Promineifilaceae bacterium]